MTPAEKVRSMGMSSLSEVSEMTGRSTRTLGNWHYHYPELFEIVVLGCRARRQLEIEKAIENSLEEKARRHHEGK